MANSIMPMAEIHPGWDLFEMDMSNLTVEISLIAGFQNEKLTGQL